MARIYWAFQRSTDLYTDRQSMQGPHQFARLLIVLIKCFRAIDCLVEEKVRETCNVLVRDGGALGKCGDNLDSGDFLGLDSV